MNQSSSPQTHSLGAVYAMLAYTSWGLLPIYWKAVKQVPALEVLSHRILWSTVFLAGILLLQHRSTEFKTLWRTPEQLRMLLITASLLAFNWGIYIYAVNSDRIIETSLGYFINPLVSVLLGLVFLKERLNVGQLLAVLLATIGVANFVWHVGTVPWIALELAVSFGLYGLVRKVVPVAPMVGLAMETLLIAPIALIMIGYRQVTGIGHFGTGGMVTVLLLGAGIITSFPLLWFNNAAKRLRLSTLGFFQYTAPSMQLVIGVFLYHEPFTHTHLITFSLIWTALLVYSVTSLYAKNDQRVRE